MTIRKLKGGYILIDNDGVEEIFTFLDLIFKKLLFYYEGCSEWFKGNSFGVVEIIREPTKEYPESALI